MSETSVKIIKNEIRCRDDTMPKTVDTRSHCKVRLRACNNLPQPLPTSRFFGVAEDCCMLSTLPCSGFLYLRSPSPSTVHCRVGALSSEVYYSLVPFWHGVIPTSYFIFNDFYTCIICSMQVFAIPACKLSIYLCTCPVSLLLYLHMHCTQCLFQS